MRLFLCIGSLLWFASSSSSQQPTLDAQSRALLEKADAALASAKSISFEECLTMGPQVGGEASPPGVESQASVSASRPDFFRVVTSGEQARLVVSDGIQYWVKTEVDGTTCRVADVSSVALDELFPVNTPDRVGRGQGVLSLFLGKRSLAEWLTAGGGACEYAGTEMVDGTKLHRLNGTVDGARVSLFLSVSEPILPMRFVREFNLTVQYAEETAPAVEGTSMFRVAFRHWRLDCAFPQNTFRLPDSGKVERVAWGPSMETNAQFVEALARLHMPKADVAPPPAPAGDAFPAGPKVYTSAKYRAQVQKAVTAYFARLYRTNREYASPVWDDQVAALHALWGEFAADRESVVLRERLRQKAVSIVAMGCRDPVVRLCTAIGGSERSGDSEGAASVVMAWDALCSSAYPASCRLIVMDCIPGLLWTLVDQKPELRERFVQEIPDLFAQTASESGFADADVRVLSHLLPGVWGAIPLEARSEALHRLARMPSADPWLLAYFGGSLLAEVAPKMKEGQAQSSTSETVEEKYQTGMRTARQQLYRAWELHPGFPEAPTQEIMISTPEEARACFDRAIAAQLDWAPAYTALRRCYAAQEGGRTWIYELGVEAAETSRFDSEAPYELWESLCRIHHLGESWRDIMARPRSFEMLESVCKGYLGRSDARQSPRFWLTVQLIGCWGKGNGEEAVEILRKLDMQPDCSACFRAGLAPHVLVAEVLLSASPYAKTGRQGLNLLGVGRVTKSIPLLREAMVGLRESEPKAAAYLSERICCGLTSDHPELAETVVDTMIDMQLRERVIGAFARWNARNDQAIPPGVRERARNYLGPIAWALLPYAPHTGELTDKEIEERVAQLDSLSLGDIHGLDGLPEEDARDLFATELALAKMRLYYCHHSDGAREAWQYCRDHATGPLASISHYGLLLDFVADHQDQGYYSHSRKMGRAMALLLHRHGPQGWDGAPDQPEAELAALREEPDRAAVRRDLWELWRRKGTPRFSLRMKSVLSGPDARADAFLLECHVLRYVRGIMGPSTDTFLWSVACEILNTVPGYENLVIGFGNDLHRGFDRFMVGSRRAAAQASARKTLALVSKTCACQADAALRRRDMETVISALIECRRAGLDDSICYDALGKRHQGTAACISAFADLLQQDPETTVKTRALLGGLLVR